MSGVRSSRFRWTVVTPVVALVVLAFSWGRHPHGVVAGLVVVVVGVFLVGAVLAAVHHAEVVAHRVGEPFGSLILAVAVTVIEVALIVTLMVTGDKDTSALARDTVFAAVMITVNGIVGLALVVGALRHHLAVFNPEGAGSALATVITLATLTLVLPPLHDQRARPGVLRLAAGLRRGGVAGALRAVRVHPDRAAPRLLPARSTGDGPRDEDGDGHADPPTGREALASLGPAGRLAGLRRRAGQGRVARRSRTASPRSGFPRGVRRRRDRAAGAAARVDRRDPGGRPATTCRSASTWPTARRWPRSG